MGEQKFEVNLYKYSKEQKRNVPGSLLQHRSEGEKK